MEGKEEIEDHEVEESEQSLKMPEIELTQKKIKKSTCLLISEIFVFVCIFSYIITLDSDPFSFLYKLIALIPVWYFIQVRVTSEPSSNKYIRSIIFGWFFEIVLIVIFLRGNPLLILISFIVLTVIFFFQFYLKNKSKSEL